MVKISIDAMGGDLGAKIVIAGAEIARQRLNDVSFVFYGKEEEVLPLLKLYPKLYEISEFIHCETVVSMEEKPSQALRNGKGSSSMWCALEAVKNQTSQACVSAGNTGALMAMSYFIFGMVPYVSRPAIAGVWPNLRGEGIVLDIGASIGADAEHLVNLAVMGACMWRALYDKAKPKIGLLNIGTEEIKGLDEIKQAAEILKKCELDGLEYFGFVEGNDIGKGEVDVVVTEGFSGNIALKAAEGTARQMASILKQAMASNIFTKIGYLFSRKAFKILSNKMDPAKVNGGVLLGLQGIVIKSHGHTTPAGFASAIRVAHEMVHNNLQEKIAKDLNYFHSNNNIETL